MGGDTHSGWASAAVRTCEAGSSPACALDCLINEVQNITKSSERASGSPATPRVDGTGNGRQVALVDGPVQDALGDAEIRRGEGDLPLGEAQGSGSEPEAAATAELAQKERVGAPPVMAARVRPRARSNSEGGGPPAEDEASGGHPGGGALSALVSAQGGRGMGRDPLLRSGHSFFHKVPSPVSPEKKVTNKKFDPMPRHATRRRKNHTGWDPRMPNPVRDGSIAERRTPRATMQHEAPPACACAMYLLYVDTRAPDRDPTVLSGRAPPSDPPTPFVRLIPLPRASVLFVHRCPRSD